MARELRYDDARARVDWDCGHDGLGWTVVSGTRVQPAAQLRKGLCGIYIASMSPFLKYI